MSFLSMQESASPNVSLLWCPTPIQTSPKIARLSPLTHVILLTEIIRVILSNKQQIYLHVLLPKH